MPIGFSKIIRGRRPLPVSSAKYVVGRAWLPTDAASATLLAWWDATDATTIATSGSNVTTWASKGVTRVATAQDTTTTYDAANKRVMLGGAGGLFAPETGFPTGSAAGCVAVVAQGSQASNSGFVFGAGNNGTNQFRVIGTSDVNTGGFRNGSGDIITTAATFNQQPLILLDMEFGTSGENRINGGAISVTATRTVSTVSSGGNVVIGRLLPGSSFRPFQGWISQIVAFSGTLSATERDKLEGFLAWTSGQQALLPAGHPYKSFAPTV